VDSRASPPSHKGRAGSPHYTSSGPSFGPAPPDSTASAPYRTPNAALLRPRLRSLQWQLVLPGALVLLLCLFLQRTTPQRLGSLWQGMCQPDLPPQIGAWPGPHCVRRLAFSCAIVQPLAGRQHPRGARRRDQGLGTKSSACLLKGMAALHIRIHYRSGKYYHLKRGLYQQRTVNRGSHV
jgi:hypothetical protein